MNFEDPKKFEAPVGCKKMFPKSFVHNAEDAGATEVDGLTVVDPHEHDEEKLADVAFEQLFHGMKPAVRLCARPRAATSDTSNPRGGHVGHSTEWYERGGPEHCLVRTGVAAEMIRPSERLSFGVGRCSSDQGAVD